MHSITLRTIVATTNRVAYSEFEMKFLLESFNLWQRNGRDLQLGTLSDPYAKGELKALAADGFLALSSPTQLLQSFIILKCDAGRSIFGRQKAAFPTYIGDSDVDEWMAGPIFKSFGMALTSIGNVYRGRGFE